MKTKAIEYSVVCMCVHVSMSQDNNTKEQNVKFVCIFKIITG